MGLHYGFECDVLERDGVLSHSLWILTGQLFAVALPVNLPSSFFFLFVCFVLFCFLRQGFSVALEPVLEVNLPSKAKENVSQYSTYW